MPTPRKTARPAAKKAAARPPRTPQDRQPKDDGSGSYRFTVVERSAQGKSITRTFTLPDVDEETALNIPGRFTYDAIMNPDDDTAQLRLAFATLEATDVDPAAVAALKSLTTKDMLEHLGAWMGKSSA